MPSYNIISSQPRYNRSSTALRNSARRPPLPSPGRSRLVRCRHPHLPSTGAGVCSVFTARSCPGPSRAFLFSPPHRFSHQAGLAASTLIHNNNNSQPPLLRAAAHMQPTCTVPALLLAVSFLLSFLPLRLSPLSSLPFFQQFRISFLPYCYTAHNLQPLHGEAADSAVFTFRPRSCPPRLGRESSVSSFFTSPRHHFSHLPSKRKK